MYLVIQNVVTLEISVIVETNPVGVMQNEVVVSRWSTRDEAVDAAAATRQRA